MAEEQLHRDRQADVALSHPEQYFDTPGYGDQLSQPVMEVRDTLEGEDRLEGLDGWEPEGRSSDQVPGLSGEMLEGTFGDDGDLEGQTNHGFSEHEAESGASLRMLVNPSANETPLSTSPETTDALLSRNARIRVADLRTRHQGQEATTLPDVSDVSDVREKK